MQLSWYVRGCEIIMLLCLTTVMGPLPQAGKIPPGLAGSARGEAQDNAQAGKIPPGLATVEVIVTDKYGKPVLDLKSEDFSILDNKIPQEIEYFSRRIPGIGTAEISVAAVTTGTRQTNPAGAAPIDPPVIYCLGYRPKNAGTETEDSRAVGVKVNRPGLMVSFLEPAGDQEGEVQRQRLIELKLQAAAAEPSEIHDINFVISGIGSKDPVVPEQLPLAIVVEGATIGFRNLGLVYFDRLHIAFFHQDPDGNFLFDSSGIVQLSLIDEEYKKVQTSGLSFSVSLPVSVQPSVLKVVIYDEGNGKSGTKIFKR